MLFLHSFVILTWSSGLGLKNTWILQWRSALHGDSRPTAGCCRLWSTGLQRDAIFRTGTEAFGLPFLFCFALHWLAQYILVEGTQSKRNERYEWRKSWNSATVHSQSRNRISLSPNATFKKLISPHSASNVHTRCLEHLLHGEYLPLLLQQPATLHTIPSPSRQINIQQLLANYTTRSQISSMQISVMSKWRI